jgi:Zn-finger nucleic acid-binding protein
MEDLVCAKCTGALEEIQVGAIALGRCEQCHGFFFDSGELASVLTDGNLGPISGGTSGPDSSVDLIPATCPRCQIPMGRLPAGGPGRFSYDLCPACHGLWLDPGELAHLEHATVSGLMEGGKDSETRRRRAAIVVEQLESLVGEIDGQREQRLARLDKLIEVGLSDAHEIRSVRGAIEAEAQLARQALAQSRLFEEARTLCIAGLISGATFESLRQRVGAKEGGESRI